MVALCIKVLLFSLPLLKNLRVSLRVRVGYFGGGVGISNFIGFSPSYFPPCIFSLKVFPPHFFGGDFGGGDHCGGGWLVVALRSPPHLSSSQVSPVVQGAQEATVAGESPLLCNLWRKRERAKGDCSSHEACRPAPRRCSCCPRWVFHFHFLGGQ